MSLFRGLIFSRALTVKNTESLGILQSVARYSDIVHRDDDDTIEIPKYNVERQETLEKRKARLLYQSRKRGMLENDLLLSTFAAKYLNNMNEDQTNLYDRLINLPSNDWDIFYWAAGHKPTPAEYNNEIMDLLKEHVENKNKDVRLRQPDLN
ncbi:succinate dehydrogenase assembly factor 2, mitochondrial isoform X2 [Arctopsyche grandis]|uniref:succinate dehydrogenase assembly factor 2, mitochondrial isoform X2 n=1 Tax=Arctopsyche grandis TaxID=121162 RepID=UPI00406D6ED6